MARQLLVLILPFMIFFGVATSYGGGLSLQENVLVTTQEHESQSPEEQESEMESLEEDPTDDDLDDDYFVKEPFSVFLCFAEDLRLNEFDLPLSPVLDQQLRPPEYA